MTTANDLNNILTVNKRVTTKDSRGVEVVSYQFLAYIYAQVIPNARKARDFFADAEIHSETTVMFRVRYCTWIDQTMQIIWKNVPYDIHGFPMDVNGKHEWLDLMAKAGPMGAR